MTVVFDDFNITSSLFITLKGFVLVTWLPTIQFRLVPTEVSEKSVSAQAGQVRSIRQVFKQTLRIAINAYAQHVEQRRSLEAVSDSFWGQNLFEHLAQPELNWQEGWIVVEAALAASPKTRRPQQIARTASHVPAA
ncbi:MAG: hypothetical protein Q9159_001859 [Coniocarpon cinnabarinum]